MNIEELTDYYKNHTKQETCKFFNITKKQIDIVLSNYKINKYSNYDYSKNKLHLDIKIFLEYFIEHNKTETIKHFNLTLGQFNKVIKTNNIDINGLRHLNTLNKIGKQKFLDVYYAYGQKQTMKLLNISENCIKYLVKHLNIDRQKHNIETKFISIDKDVFIKYYNQHNRDETTKQFNMPSAHVLTDYCKYIHYTKPDDVIMANRIKTNHERYGVPFYCMAKDYHISHGSNSKPNIAFEKILKDNNITYEREFALDKYIYDFKIGNNLIEINPTETHNVDYQIFDRTPMDKYYHRNKTLCASINGYRCINIWDWDDKNKIILLFEPRETVYARKCIIKEVTEEQTTLFINKHHLQGYAKDKIRIGLFYNEKLISIMTFNKPRYNKNYEWELIRYCSSLGIVGGAEKLFSYFVKKYSPNSIVSYCDMSKFSGKTYVDLNFRLIRKSVPSCHWYNIKTKRHITDNLLRQRGYDQLFGTRYGKNSSNEKLMLDNGFVRIYDAGQATYVWTKKHATQNNI